MNPEVDRRVKSIGSKTYGARCGRHRMGGSAAVRATCNGSIQIGRLLTPPCSPKMSVAAFEVFRIYHGRSSVCGRLQAQRGDARPGTEPPARLFLMDCLRGSFSESRIVGVMVAKCASAMSTRQSVELQPDLIASHEPVLPGRIEPDPHRLAMPTQASLGKGVLQFFRCSS